MSKKVIKKKSDFFNGGKGVDLSQHYSQMSLEDDEDESSDAHEFNRNSRYPSYEEPSLSASSSGYFSNNQSSYCSSASPRVSPTPENYPSFPNPYNQIEYNPDLQRPPHDPYLYTSEHANALGGHISPPLSPQIPSYTSYPIAGAYVQPPLQGYSHPAHGSYPPVRPLTDLAPLDDVYNPAVMAIPDTSSDGTANCMGGVEHPKKAKRQQKCSLCKNHGITIDVKGHKWFCRYRNCECERCEITKGRQHHMKEQQKLTRSLQRHH